MFNSLSRLPDALYNIIVYLATEKSEEAENLWKLLKYNSYDALSKPNLTTTEKLDMLWKDGKQEDYSVFMTGRINDAIAEERCILKIYDYMIAPDDLYTGTVLFAFDFLHGAQMALVERNGVPCARDDIFVNSILTVLNGKDVGGVGKMAFTQQLSRYSGGKWVVGNQRNFEGYCLYLGTNMGDTGDEVCD